MGQAARAKLLAAILLCLFLFGIAVLAADLYVDANYRHVVAGVSNVDDTVRVDVNCRRALTVSAGEGPESIDLGRLSPADRIYISVYNERGGATWTVKVDNGETVRVYSDGHAGVTGRTGPYGIAMAEMLTADGDRIGTLGCAPPALVSDSVPDYQQSADAHTVSRRAEGAPLWDPPTFPFALIEDLADLLWLFAVAGYAAAIAIPGMRTLIRRHLVFGGTLNLLLGLLGLMRGGVEQALCIIFTGTGLILLLVSAIVVGSPHTGIRCLTSCSTPDPKPNPE